VIKLKHCTISEFQGLNTIRQAHHSSKISGLSAWRTEPEIGDACDPRSCYVCESGLSWREQSNDVGCTPLCPAGHRFGNLAKGELLGVLNWENLGGKTIAAIVAAFVGLAFALDPSAV